MQNDGPKAQKRAKKAILLHTFGLQVEARGEPDIGHPPAISAQHPATVQGCLVQGNKLPPIPDTIIVTTIKKEAVYFFTRVNFKRQRCHSSRFVHHCLSESQHPTAGDPFHAAWDARAVNAGPPLLL